MHLKVLTWNIHKGIGGVDRRYRPDRTVEVIVSLKPDIAFLQEVDDAVPRSGFHRQVDVIGDAVGLRHRAFWPNVRLRRGCYGNAILSRWPLSAVRNIDLTIGPKKRRGALHARCRVRVGRQLRTVVLYNMHLGLAGFERGLQLRRFLASHPFAHLHPRTPVILGGDFNDLWGTLGARHLDPAGFVRASLPIRTYPAILPLRPLDALYARGDIRALRGYRSREGMAGEASDHLPLLAEFVLVAHRSAQKDAESRPGSASREKSVVGTAVVSRIHRP